MTLPSSDRKEAGVAAAKRLTSLDVFRGWTMFWIVGGTGLVAGLQHLGPNPLINGLVTYSAEPR
jgi:hypothetical protein